MIIQKLNGKWELNPIGTLKGELLKPLKKGVIQASVPGDVYKDLLDNKLIKDPFYRDTENEYQWIGRQGFKYSRSFKVSKAMLSEDAIELLCHGLDTLATLKINGKKVVQTDNMFRTYCLNVKKFLKEGDNEIEVLFDPAVPHVNKKDSKRQLPYWARTDLKQNAGPFGYIRKMACNFGWDWGVKLVTSGIWKDIELKAYSKAKIDHIQIEQKHTKKNVEVTADLSVVKSGSASLKAIASLSLNGKTVVQKELSFKSKATLIHLKVEDPQLWWPNTMGDQPLYELSVELLDSENNSLDKSLKTIGLRTLELDRHKDKWGESFQFVVNGVPFFSKGGNWIPSDGIMARMTQNRYEQMVADCANANMNMLRVWGGGIYESEDFYDACDKYGICVWQDFMVACTAFPSYDKQIVASFKQEAIDNVKRIHHRSCVALWCGNNELEQGLVQDEWNEKGMAWKDYTPIFDKMLGDVVAKLAPQTAYWPGSPHTSVGDRKDFNNPRSGDAHLWSVWHGKLPFEWYRSCEHRFNSEFGFQSFPEPKTVATYTAKQDENITSRVMEHHQRSGIGNTTIMTYMLDWFRLPSDFENTIWLSQILQGMAIKYACEHWRRSMPQGMGTLYWQINDTWQVASWSSIDYFGRWKALQFMSKNFFAPILVSALEDKDKATVELHLTSDRLKAVKGLLSWKVTTLEGKVVDKGSKQVTTPINGSKNAHTLKLNAQVEKYQEHNLLVWTSFKTKGEKTSRNISFFARPKHMDLLKPKISSKITQKKNGSFAVELTTNVPALWSWLEFEGLDVSLSDNFIHLCPGEKITLDANPFINLKGNASKLTLAQLKKSLKIKSLWDTYI